MVLAHHLCRLAQADWETGTSPSVAVGPSRAGGSPRVFVSTRREAPAGAAGNRVAGRFAASEPGEYHPAASALPHVRSGKLIALASTGRTRTAATPNLPTMAEAGLPDYDLSSWFGLFVPSGVPRPIIDKLSGEVVQFLRAPATREKYAPFGTIEPPSFHCFILTECALYVIESLAINRVGKGGIPGPSV